MHVSPSVFIVLLVNHPLLSIVTIPVCFRCLLWSVNRFYFSSESPSVSFVRVSHPYFLFFDITFCFLCPGQSPALSFLQCHHLFPLSWSVTRFFFSSVSPSVSFVLVSHPLLPVFSLLFPLTTWSSVHFFLS